LAQQHNQLAWSVIQPMTATTWKEVLKFA